LALGAFSAAQCGTKSPRGYPHTDIKIFSTCFLMAFKTFLKGFQKTVKKPLKGLLKAFYKRPLKSLSKVF
jgi:hypothetical protein